MCFRQMVKIHSYLQIWLRMKFYERSRYFSPMLTRRLIFVGVPLLVVETPPEKNGDKFEKNKLEMILKPADDLYDATDYKALFVLLEKHKHSEEPEVLWRYARALFEMREFAADNKEKVSLLEEALDTVTHALELDETCGPAHKWRAILLDHVWRTRDIKGRLVQSFVIKEHLEKAIKYSPSDSTSYYIYGEWHYALAGLPWYQRKLASALFTSPPDASFEEALTFFMKAENLNPGFYSMNYIMLAKCLLLLGFNKDEVIRNLIKARDYPQKTKDDKQAYQEAMKMLEELGISD